MKPSHASYMLKAARVLICALLLMCSFSQSGSVQAQTDTLPGAGKTRLEKLESALSQVYGSSHADLQRQTSLKKLDSHLQALVTDKLQNANLAESAIREGITLDHENVAVDIYTTGPFEAARQQLEAQGMQILAGSETFGILEGLLSVSAILNTANLDSVKALMPVMAFGADAGSVISEGDGSHNGPAARSLGVNGAGVVVGVISDSINQVGSGISGSQATHDLPANVTVITDDSTGSVDEGRAMSEIVYDMAPGITNMFFASGTASGAVGKASAINSLVANHVNIIADDIFYLNEPFFQDGPVSQAVDAAVNAGVAYFASAGNRARQSYESNYRSNSGSTYHDFLSGSGIDELQTLFTLGNQDGIEIVLQWDDPWGAATHDFDFYLYDTTDLSAPLALSESDNIMTGLPIETLDWTNNTGRAVSIGVAISRFSGTGASFLKYIIHSSGNNGFLSINQFDTASDTINPDAASAAGSLTVAAINWGESGLNDPEPFSSGGLKTRLFDVNGNRFSPALIRQKPQIAGADCVTTTVPDFAPFCGTSAATPSVAGVAALVKSVQPELTPAQLYAILTDPLNTIDCTATGRPDRDCGYGFVLSDLAVASAFNIISPAKNQTVSAGKFNQPATIVVRVSKPANGLTSSAFTVTIGGANATILSIQEETSDYLLQVLPPNQASNGAYDLVAKVNVRLRGVARSFSFRRAGAVRYAANSGSDTTGVFRPGNGVIFLKNSNTSGFADIALNYGIPGDYPVVGDWDGNGTATIGVYRNGMFLLRNSNTVGFADLAFAFGQPGDQPIAGDWNGDGVDTIGVYRPSLGEFLLRNSNSAGPAEMAFFLGIVGDVGIAGDWNGDGMDTTGVFRPGNGVIFLKNSNTSGFADIALNYGIRGDRPVTGDWNNDGVDTIGVYRNGQFLLRNSNTVGFADLVFGLGIPGDMPIAGNWDGIP